MDQRVVVGGTKKIEKRWSYFTPIYRSYDYINPFITIGFRL